MITATEQLNRYLYKQERKHVNGFIKELESAEDRELARLILLARFKYPDVAIRTDNSAVLRCVGLCFPHIEMCRRKLCDADYNILNPEDHPVENNSED